MSLVKYNAILVDTEIESRMRLKQATASVIDFGQVSQVTSLEQAHSALEGESRYDVVFISHGFEDDEIKGFITKGKETKWGQDCAYVMVLKTDDQGSAAVAENVMVGADGILFEPYSVDQLVEITKLAARVKKERGLAREHAAMNFLLNDVMDQLDMMAFLKSRGYDVGRGIKKFKQMCRVFQSLEGESKALYFQMAVDKFVDAPLPKKFLQQKNYSGASSRVKKRMEEKLLKELEKGLKDDDDDKPKSKDDGSSGEAATS